MHIQRAIGLLLFLAACGGRAAERRAQLDADGRALEQSLDDLGARLIEDQARVHFWQEMRDRHQQVSAIACGNLGRQAEAMARFERHEQEKRVAGRRSRMASHFSLSAQ